MTEPERKWLRVADFVEHIDGVLDAGAIYEAVKDDANPFPHARVGRRIFIPSDALDQLLERNKPDHTGNGPLFGYSPLRALNIKGGSR